MATNLLVLCVICFIAAPRVVESLNLGNLFNFKINYVLPYDKFVNKLNLDETTILNFAELATNNGYNSQEHTVTTKDGYIIKLFRIRSPRCSATKGVPVFILHGIIESSDVFLDAGVDNGLAYLIANECRDVWAGNYRGNYYGRAHQTLNPDKDAEFWHFGPDEVALYDVPAQFNYVLNITGSDQLNYIGYSMGGVLPYILNNEDPEYVTKVMKSNIGIAPVSRMINTKSVLLRALFTGSGLLDLFEKGNGIQEIFFRGSLTQTTLGLFCQLNNSLIHNTLCASFFDLLDTPHPGSISDDTYDLMFSHSPAGNSIRIFEWLDQKIKSGRLAKYDFGADQNIEVYGSAEPPLYNLSSFVIPTMMLHGANDHVIDPLDVQWLSQQLPNVVEVFQVADPLWNHVDNVYNKNIATELFPTLKKYLDMYL